MIDTKYTCEENSEDWMKIRPSFTPGGVSFKAREEDATTEIILNNDDVRDLYGRLGEVLGKEPEKMFRADVNASEVRVGDRIKVTCKSGDTATITTESVKNEKHFRETETNFSILVNLDSPEIERLDILERPKTLPTRGGARIKYIRARYDDTVILTFTGNSCNPWRGYDDVGTDVCLSVEHLTNYPGTWELIKD